MSGAVTISPSVTDRLEDRVTRTETLLSRPPVSKDNRTLCDATVSSVGVGWTGDYQSVRCGRFRRPGLNNEYTLESTSRVVGKRVPL